MPPHRRLPLLLLLLLLPPVAPDASADKLTLLSFLSGLRSRGRVRWNPALPACSSYTGVTCDANATAVTALRLPGAGLVGPIPPSTISRLPSLRALSLRANSLFGDLPADLANLSSLRALYLQRNRFSGTLDALRFLRLRRLDVSFNNFSGPIPAELHHFPAASFAGNPGLCGPPLAPCSVEPPPPSRRRRRRRLPTAAIAIPVAAVAAVVILVVAVIACRCRKGGRPQAAGITAKSSDSRLRSSSTSTGPEAATRRNGLMFLGDGPRQFGLEDLLRASAEMLGKGGAGITYRAVLRDGSAVAVKRLTGVSATRRDFELLMLALSRLRRHPNLVPLRAYYHSKHEKLLVYDYYEGGSLRTLLQQQTAGWLRRLRVALAVARGLAYLHTTARLVHGNVCASNVMLGEDADEATLSDAGLWQLSAPTGATRPTYKSDLHAYGLLLLHLLTGQSPASDRAVEFVRWVRSAEPAQVLEAGMVAGGEVDEGMVELLRLAVRCTAEAPGGRPEMREVAAAVEGIARRAAGTEALEDAG